MQRVTQHNNTKSIQNITEALITCGYTSLDQQAKALGLHRSTTWTIIKAKHKLGRLSTKTTDRILANPETPPPVRAAIGQYLAERSDILAQRNSKMKEQHANPNSQIHSANFADSNCGFRNRSYRDLDNISRIRAR